MHSSNLYVTMSIKQRRCQVRIKLLSFWAICQDKHAIKVLCIISYDIYVLHKTTFFLIETFVSEFHEVMSKLFVMFLLLLNKYAMFGLCYQDAQICTLLTSSNCSSVLFLLFTQKQQTNCQQISNRNKKNDNLTMSSPYFKVFKNTRHHT